MNYAENVYFSALNTFAFIGPLITLKLIKYTNSCISIIKMPRQHLLI